MADVLLQTVNLTKNFGNTPESRVLFGINLEVLKGEFISLIGASGSGKSTFLNILGALDRPTSGDIYIDGIDLKKLNDDQLAYFRNRTIGFIFQSHFLLPQFTILENVLIPYQIYAGKVPPKIYKRALELLDLVGLSHCKDSRANVISGGEQQRGAIARSLINNPRLILADEPTGNLDSNNTLKVFALLQNINKELNSTFIMVTHDQNLAVRAKRMIELKDGLIIKDTPILGQPLSQRWADSLPDFS